MVNYEETYQNALMADAAYIKFEPFKANGGIHSGNAALINKFVERGFTRGQAEVFLDRYQVSHHQPNTRSGFSATVFIDRENNDKPTVSFRGTELGLHDDFLDDLVQDLMLALGLSELAPFSQHKFTHSFLYHAALVDECGKPTKGLLKGVNFVGHSLGGYLALMAAYDYPQLVDKVFTYNGAGIGLYDSFYNEIVRPFLDKSSKLDESKVYNFYAEAGIELIAGQVNNNISLFYRPGNRIGLFTEYQGSGLISEIDNHSMLHLVKALSVGRILYTMDNTLTIASIDKILYQSCSYEIEKSSTNENALTLKKSTLSLDNVMRHLAVIMGGDFSAYTKTQDAHDFYEALKGLAIDLAVYDFEKINTFLENSHHLNRDTAENRAYMYALLESTPFTVYPAAYSKGIFSPSSSNNRYNLSHQSTMDECLSFRSAADYVV